MKRWRRWLRDGWLLVSACAAATAAMVGSTSLKDLAQELVAEQEQNDAIHELADERAQFRSVADVDSDAVRPTALRRGEPPAHLAAQQSSPSALRGLQQNSLVVTTRAEEVAASDDGGLGGSSQLEYESQRLHEMLAFTSGYEKKLETQLKKVPLLQRKIASEHERGRKLKMQLYNATRSVAQHKRDLDQAKQHLGSLQRENSDLSGAMHNMTAARKVLEAELVKSIYHREEGEVALGKAKTALSNSGGTGHAIKKLRQSLRQAEERAVEVEGHSKSEKAAAKNALHRLAQLQQGLNSTDRKLAGEVARDDQLNKTSTSFVEQLQADRAAVSKGAVQFQRLSIANHKFTKEVVFLKRRVAASDNARKHGHAVAAETQHSLARADAEVKQVKGLVPWLQDKAAAGERELKQAASEARAAYEARDVATAMVDEAQKKIVDLEQQYASVVQGLAARKALPPPPSWEQETAAAAAPPPPNLSEVASWTSAEDEAVLE